MTNGGECSSLQLLQTVQYDSYKYKRDCYKYKCKYSLTFVCFLAISATSLPVYGKPVAMLTHSHFYTYIDICHNHL